MISDPDHQTPCTPVRVRAEDGAHLVACAQGGQLLGWTPAGEERDRLWLSPLARCAPGQAIRGGVPVIFPQFAARGPGPRHGLARNRAWELDTGSSPAPVARIAGQLTDDETTLALWPHRFVLTLVIEASGADLTLTLRVRHDGAPGEAPFTFAAALHTYLALRGEHAAVEGLAGCVAEDNTAAGRVFRLPAAPMPATTPRDLAIAAPDRPVLLDDGAGGMLSVTREGDQGTGFDSWVVWNPGPEHGLPDVPPDGWARFLCLEPARLAPVLLHPQQTWSGGVRLTALVPGR